MTQIIGIANQKGGVGKTTTAHNLSSAMAKKKFKVLMIDLDPQGNLTDSCGIQLKLKPNDPNTMDVLAGTPINQAIKNINEYLDLVPATLQLAGADLFFMSAIRREDKLFTALQSLLEKNVYDLIVLDCPPNLGLITQNAYRCMTGVIIPVECEYHALQALKLVHECINLWKSNNLLRADFQIFGILPTKFDARLKLHKDVLNAIRQDHAESLLKTIIRNNIRLSEAPSNGMSIFDYCENCNGSKDYLSLADEIIDKIKLRETK